MTNPDVYMGKISYINASPVFYGLDHGLLPDWLKMVPDVPSVLNRKILDGKIKVSPISAAFYAMNHKELLLLPDLSISSHDRVLSVILASHYPIEELSGKKVLFSPESATSTSFLKMIFSRKKITPVYETAPVNDCFTVSKTADAALVIGDTSLTQPWNDVYPYQFDLGQIWYEMTKLPFVFAVWVVRRSFAKKYPQSVQKIHALLLESRKIGYQNIEKVIDAGRDKLKIDRSVVSLYYNLLFCDLDDLKIRAMSLFFDSLFEQGVIKEKAAIEFFNPSEG